MKFTVPADTFALAVQAAAHSASRSGPMEILRGSHWRTEGGKLAVSCTDMQSCSTAVVDCETGQAGELVVSLPTAQQLKTLKALKGETVTLETGDMPDGGRGGTALLTAGSTRCTVRTAPTEDYPRLPVLGATVPLDTAAFAAVLASVLPSASDDESRPILTGVNLEAKDSVLTLAATDSFRLRIRSMPAPGLPEAAPCLPATSLEIVGKHLRRKGCTLAYGPVGDDGKRSGFRIASEGLDVTVTTRHVDGTFPNWRQLLPDTFEARVGVPRERFAQTLARLMAVMNVRSNAPLRMSLNGTGELGLSLAYDGVRAEDALPLADVQPWTVRPESEMTVGVNPAFMLDGLQSFADDTVTLQAINPLRPMLLTGGAHVPEQAGGGWADAYLLMPIRLAG